MRGLHTRFPVCWLPSAIGLRMFTGFQIPSCNRTAGCSCTYRLPVMGPNTNILPGFPRGCWSYWTAAAGLQQLAKEQLLACSSRRQMVQVCACLLPTSVLSTGIYRGLPVASKGPLDRAYAGGSTPVAQFTGSPHRRPATSARLAATLNDDECCQDQANLLLLVETSSKHAGSRRQRAGKSSRKKHTTASAAVGNIDVEAPQRSTSILAQDQGASHDAQPTAVSSVPCETVSEEVQAAAAGQIDLAIAHTGTDSTAHQSAEAATKHQAASDEVHEGISDVGCVAACVMDAVLPKEVSNPDGRGADSRDDVCKRKAGTRRRVSVKRGQRAAKIACQEGVNSDAGNQQEAAGLLSRDETVAHQDNVSSTPAIAAALMVGAVQSPAVQPQAVQSHADQLHAQQPCMSESHGTQSNGLKSVAVQSTGGELTSRTGLTAEHTSGRKSKRRKTQRADCNVSLRTVGEQNPASIDDLHASTSAGIHPSGSNEDCSEQSKTQSTATETNESGCPSKLQLDNSGRSGHATSYGELGASGETSSSSQTDSRIGSQQASALLHTRDAAKNGSIEVVSTPATPAKSELQQRWDAEDGDLAESAKTPAAPLKGTLLQTVNAAHQDSNQDANSSATSPAPSEESLSQALDTANQQLTGNLHAPAMPSALSIHSSTSSSSISPSSSVHSDANNTIVAGNSDLDPCPPAAHRMPSTSPPPPPLPPPPPPPPPPLPSLPLLYLQNARESPSISASPALHRPISSSVSTHSQVTYSDEGPTSTFHDAPWNEDSKLRSQNASSNMHVQSQVSDLDGHVFAQPPFYTSSVSQSRVSSYPPHHRPTTDSPSSASTSSQDAKPPLITSSQRMVRAPSDSDGRRRNTDESVPTTDPMAGPEASPTTQTAVQNAAAHIPKGTAALAGTSEQMASVSASAPKSTAANSSHIEGSPPPVASQPSMPSMAHLYYPAHYPTITEVQYLLRRRIGQLFEITKDADQYTPVFLDFETAGFSRLIVQLCFQCGIDTPPFSTLVNPGRNFTEKAFGTEVHGISPDDVKTAPRWSRVALHLLTYLYAQLRARPGVPVLVGHNIERFDIPILIQSLAQVNVLMPPNWMWLDTLKWSRHYYKSRKSNFDFEFPIAPEDSIKPARFSLGTLHEFFGCKVEGRAHSAVTDVAMARNIYLQLLELGKPSCPDLQELMQLTGVTFVGNVGDLSITSINDSNKLNVLWRHMPWSQEPIEFSAYADMETLERRKRDASKKTKRSSSSVNPENERGDMKEADAVRIASNDSMHSDSIGITQESLDTAPEQHEHGDLSSVTRSSEPTGSVSESENDVLNTAKLEVKVEVDIRPQELGSSKNAGSLDSLMQEGEWTTHESGVEGRRGRRQVRKSKKSGKSVDTSVEEELSISHIGSASAKDTELQPQKSLRVSSGKLAEANSTVRVKDNDALADGVQESCAQNILQGNGRELGADTVIQRPSVKDAHAADEVPVTSRQDTEVTDDSWQHLFLGVKSVQQDSMPGSAGNVADGPQFRDSDDLNEMPEGLEGGDASPATKAVAGRSRSWLSRMRDDGLQQPHKELRKKKSSTADKVQDEGRELQEDARLTNMDEEYLRMMTGGSLSMEGTQKLLEGDVSGMDSSRTIGDGVNAMVAADRLMDEVTEEEEEQEEIVMDMEEQVVQPDPAAFLEAALEEEEDQPVMTPEEFAEWKCGSLDAVKPLALSVAKSKAFTAKQVKQLEDAGFNNLLQVLMHYPRDYFAYSQTLHLEDPHEAGQVVSVHGVVARSRASRMGRLRSCCELIIETQTVCGSTVRIKAFRVGFGGGGFAASSSMSAMAIRFHPGAAVRFKGRVKQNSRLRLAEFEAQSTPGWEIALLSELDEEELQDRSLDVIYPARSPLEPKDFIGTAKREGVITRAFKALEGQPGARDVLPSSIVQELKLMGWMDALKAIHSPNSFEEKDAAVQRLAFQEYFMVQVTNLLQRNIFPTQSSAIGTTMSNLSLVQAARKAFKFKLTNSQERVLNEVLGDLTRKRPMFRLLQGDVGSGKTIIAFLALMAAVGSGMQGVLMAPTEVLARQHFHNLDKLVQDMPERLRPRLALLSGGEKLRSKRQIAQDIMENKVDIVIGTNALLFTKDWPQLGLLIIDEQHRFGVRQRAKLAEKAGNRMPHILAMTATPIPRTLAMAHYGDMHLSQLTEVPPGRKIVQTTVLADSSENHEQVYELINREVEKGGRAYIVLPLVETSSSDLMEDVKDAISYYENLKDSRSLRDIRIGLLHGRMSPADKERAVSDFKTGKTPVLVCTTVIEVGVDVPAASVMVVEHAERFGLATLHQLRGRVGRGNQDSYCVLFNALSKENDRLKVMEMSHEGHVIAQHDLAIRGPGDFLGTRQHGQLHLSAPATLLLYKDKALMEKARLAAQMVVSTNQITPELKAALLAYNFFAENAAA